MFAQIQQKMLMNRLKQESLFKKPALSIEDLSAKGLCTESSAWKQAPACQYRSRGSFCGKSETDWISNAYFYLGPKRQQSINQMGIYNVPGVNCQYEGNECDILATTTCKVAFSSEYITQNQTETEFFHEDIYIPAVGSFNTSNNVCTPKGYTCGIVDSNIQLQYDESAEAYCNGYANTFYNQSINDVFAKELTHIEKINTEVPLPKVIKDLSNTNSDNLYRSPLKHGFPFNYDSNKLTNQDQCFMKDTQPLPSDKSGCPGHDTQMGGDFVPVCQKDGDCKASGCGGYSFCHQGTCSLPYQPKKKCVSSQECTGSCNTCINKMCMLPKAQALSHINWKISQLYLTFSPLTFKSSSYKGSQLNQSIDWMQLGFQMQEALHFYMRQGNTVFSDIAKETNQVLPNKELMIKKTFSNIEDYYDQILLLFTGFAAERFGVDLAAGSWQLAVCIASLGTETAMCERFGELAVFSSLALGEDLALYGVIAALQTGFRLLFVPSALFHTYSHIHDNYANNLPFALYSDLGGRLQTYLTVRSIGTWTAITEHGMASYMMNKELTNESLGRVFHKVLGKLDSFLVSPLYILSMIMTSYYPMIPTLFWVAVVLGVTISCLYFIMAFPFFIIGLMISDRGDEEILGKVAQAIGTILIFLMRPVLYIVAFILSFCFYLVS